MIADHFQPVNRPIRPVWLRGLRALSTTLPFTLHFMLHFKERLLIRRLTAASNFLPMAAY